MSKRQIKEISSSNDENSQSGSSNDSEGKSSSDYSEDEANLSEESKNIDDPTSARIPHSEINKPNDFEDRKAAKRITDLENLYGLLPDIEPDVVEIHYDQFEGNAEKTYEFLNRGLNPYNRNIVVINSYGNSQPQNNNYVPVEPLNQDIMMVNNASIPMEEKKMISKALRKEKKKEIKKVTQARKIGF